MTNEINELNDINEEVAVAPVESIKKLTIAELEKQNEQLDGQRTFTVTIGGTEFELSHDLVFRKTKQHKLLDDVIQFFSEGVKNIEVLDIATPYTALLILKHFTSLEVSDDIEEAIALLDVLIDLEVLDKIVNELPEDQVVGIYELLSNTVKNIQETMEDADAETEELLEKVENQEVKDMIKNGEKE